MRIKSFPQIASEMLTAVGQRTPLSNFNAGSTVRTLVEVFAAATSELYVFVGEALRQAYLGTATGPWLDLKAAEYGVTRKPAVAAEGVLYFTRRAAKPVNVVIPQGTLVATGVDAQGIEVRFITADAAVLAADTTEIAVPVVAESSGKSGNVGPFAIRRLKTFLAGIDGVENRANWQTLEGTDAESDDSLRARAFLAWEELTRGSTRGAYLAWALSVPGVRQAWVNDTLPRGQGTVDVYILSEAGLPGPALIAAVQTVVDGKRPLTANVLASAPQGRTVDIDARITPYLGFDTAQIDAEIRRRLSVWFAGESDPALGGIRPVAVGRELVRMQVIEALVTVEGVHNLELVSPANDTGVAPYELPVLGAVDLAFRPGVEL